jgi:chemotaxis protein CheC
VILTETQRDALVELLNIGFGRAGAALSKLTGQRILLDVPVVDIHPVAQLNESLRKVGAGNVASVHQVFSGPVAGDALLILDPAAASTLKELLTDEPALPLELDASSKEVLTEVGNILLNACIGTFGNLLKVPMSFTVPDIDIASLRSVVSNLVAAGDAMRYALVVTAGFRLRDAEVTGYVVIVLTVQSLTTLLIAVEEWVAREEGQG